MDIKYNISKLKNSKIEELKDSDELATDSAIYDELDALRKKEKEEEEEVYRMEQERIQSSMK